LPGGGRVMAEEKKKKQDKPKDKPKK
jgi:hypothetical protein